VFLFFVWGGGARKAGAGTVSVRDRKGETTTMELDEFIAKVTAEKSGSAGDEDAHDGGDD